MTTILVIDSQMQTRTLLMEGLSAQGFNAIAAENGETGIQQAQEQRPDLIICDMRIPEIDGYSVLAALRQVPATAIIPFIFVADHADRLDLRKAMELGANDYLTQPCPIEVVLDAVKTQLEKQTVRRQGYAEQPIARSAEPDSIDPVPRSIESCDPQVYQAFRFIEANYHRSITLSDVAQAVGYSPAYLTDLMRRQTGHTIQQWIINRRMAAARSLLVETDLVVEQIAAQVGYQHAVHFFRQFRKFHGTTPKAWRSTHRPAIAARRQPC